MIKKDHLSFEKKNNGIINFNLIILVIIIHFVEN